MFSFLNNNILSVCSLSEIFNLYIVAKYSNCECSGKMIFGSDDSDDGNQGRYFI